MEEKEERVGENKQFLKRKCPIYSFYEVQASKTQCTPHRNGYNSQTVLDIHCISHREQMVRVIETTSMVRKFHSK